MVFPLYDDNSDRTITPIVNYALIAINILVFVFLQQLGNNDRFTYAFSTVPQEIVSGRDVKTPDRVVEHPVTGQRLLIPGLQPTPFSVYLTLIFSMFMHGGIAHIAGNMLVPLDLRRQRRRPHGPSQVPDLLSCLRRAGFAGACNNDSHAGY